MSREVFSLLRFILKASCTFPCISNTPYHKEFIITYVNLSIISFNICFLKTEHFNFRPFGAVSSKKGEKPQLPMFLLMQLPSRTRFPASVHHTKQLPRQ